MIRIHFDSPSTNVLRFPRADQRSQVLALARDFASYEAALPLEQQTPYTVQINDLLAQFEPVYANKISAEAQRSVASETLKEYDAEAKVLIDQMVGMMHANFPMALEQAEKWGFAFKQSTQRLLKPKKLAERLTLLSNYIAYEEQRLPEERFPTPVLEEVIRIRDGLQQSLAARKAGKAQRKSSVAISRDLSPQLLNHLKAAAVYILAHQFNYMLTPDLQKWGFDVVGARNGASHATTNGNGAVPVS